MKVKTQLFLCDNINRVEKHCVFKKRSERQKEKKTLDVFLF